MTKTKRVAVVAVAVVLAGTMAVSLTACKKNKSTHEAKAVNMAYESGTTLNAAIGYNSADTGMFFSEKAGATNTTIVGGYTMNAYSAKPATKAIMDALDIKISDAYSGSSTSANLTDLVNKNSWNSTVDMATSDLSVAATEAAKGTVLNLADYLQYMPNFQKFLNDNPIVYLSLLQGGMDTETGEGQALYVAPYFDGMDDIEKGVLMRHDWVEAVLDNKWGTPTTNDASNDTFYTACYSGSGVNKNTAGTQTYATSYMGTTGSWTIVSTAESEDGEENDGSETITIKKDYDEALKAFTSTTSNDQTMAYAAVAGEGKTYSGTSGNIVDIMNAAITEDLATSAKTGASGENLANLYKAYIDAAYTADTEGDGSYVTYYGNAGTAYSKVFTGYSGCWDVDDLTALLRIIKCSSGQVGLDAGYKTVGIFPRTYDNGRTPDLVSLVGELYGCRGATSRYEQTYIDSDGVLQDARNDEKFWNSLMAFGGLCSEGLVEGGYTTDAGYYATPNTYTDDLHGVNGTNNTLKEEGFMQWDYSQTQTVVEFTNNEIEYGWVNTPVSLWDDGTYDNEKINSASDYAYSYNTSTGEKYMRFTDSWRSTKTSGLVVAASVENDENKLAAALSFVDFLYSNDGQITTTYAIQSTNGNINPNGTWYGEEINDLSTIDGGIVSGSEGNDKGDGTQDYTSLCDETYQWVIKEEYRDTYVMWNGLICNKDKTPATLDEYDSEGVLVSSEDISTQYETYADRVSYYAVKEEYQGKCFTYGGNIYTGTLYKGKMTPTITTELYTNFTGADSEENKAYSARGSFTDFARKVLGSTLPICVKDQSFENQMTATYAKNCATVVGVSIGNGTINHCELKMTDWNYFYTCVPTGFPLETRDQNGLDASTQTQLKYLSGSAYEGSAFYSLFIHVMWYGYTGTYSQNQCNVNFSTISSASGMISYYNTYHLDTRIDILRTGWENAVSYWGYLGKL